MGRPRRADTVSAATSGAVRVAAYLRVSTEDQQRDGYGLDAQESGIRAYIAAQGWELVERYEDAESGTKADRPALRRMLADARAGVFTRIIVYKLDRLGRSLRDLLALYDELEHMGVAVVSVRESLDTATPYGRFFRNILASLAEFERDIIVDRIKGGQVERARQGKSLSGYLPLGYVRAEDGGWAIDPATAPTVRRIFAERAAGHTYQRIADGLNGDAIPTARGGTWTASTVYGILANPVYTTGRPAWSKRTAKPVSAERAAVPVLVPDGGGEDGPSGP